MDLDGLLKTFVTLCGMGLIGSMVIRTNARGKWRLVQCEFGPLFEPRWAGAAKWIAAAFAIGVLLAVSRGSHLI